VRQLFAFTAICAKERISSGGGIDPVVLFPIPGGRPTSWAGGRRSYAPSRDGNRFLITRPLDETTNLPITVFLNWQSALAKR
jgi:hypothetical protein